MTSPTDALFLFELPLQTLVVFAAGYLAYRLAFTGRDMSHKSVDIVFATFVFAAVARLVIALAGDQGPSWWYPNVVYAVAVTVALSVAALWRVMGAHTVAKLLRWAGISTSDGQKTALDSIISSEGNKPSQLIIRKTDGSMVMCRRLADFAAAAFGPCLLGEDGSVALYITDFRPSPGTDWEEEATVENEWGPPLTFIPSSQISEITLRYPLTA